MKKMTMKKAMKKYEGSKMDKKMDMKGAKKLMKKAAKKPKLGTGKRFASLSKKLAKKGVNDPKALAASIGRKKYGAKKMASMAAKGKKK